MAVGRGDNCMSLGVDAIKARLPLCDGGETAAHRVEATGDVRPRVDVKRRTGRAVGDMQRSGGLRTDVTRRRCGRGRSLAD